VAASNIDGGKDTKGKKEKKEGGPFMKKGGKREEN